MSKSKKSITDQDQQNLIPDQDLKKPIEKNDKFDFNNKDLKIWLSANYPKSIIFEFERGNLPYYIFETYLQAIK